LFCIAAAVNQPAFGSVTQSSNAGSVGGLTTDAASVTFDGTDVELSVTREDGSSFMLDGASARFASIPLEKVMDGYTFRGDGLLGWDEESITLAAVYTNWNDTDPTDYLAGGYWMHLEGSTDPLTVTGAEIGAFVDGDEIDGTPTLPNSGQASYTGQAGGLYAAYNAVGVEVGEFHSDSSLDADFATNTVSGCIGCDYTLITSVAADNAGNVVGTYVSHPVNAHLELGDTQISEGAFRSKNVTFVFDGTSRTTDGSWGGRFSNTATSVGGNPRLAAGTAGAEWTNPDGVSGGVVVGAWFATE